MLIFFADISNFQGFRVSIFQNFFFSLYQKYIRGFQENCHREKLSPSPNSNANPKPNTEPDRWVIFLGGNFSIFPRGGLWSPPPTPHPPNLDIIIFYQGLGIILESLANQPMVKNTKNCWQSNLFCPILFLVKEVAVEI